MRRAQTIRIGRLVAVALLCGLLLLGGGVTGVEPATGGAGDTEHSTAAPSVESTAAMRPLTPGPATASPFNATVHRPPDHVSRAAVDDGDQTAQTESTEDTIRVRHELTPTDEPGTVRVVTRARQIPDRVTSLRLTLASPTDGRVRPEGFERVERTADETTWEWDGETTRPALTYAMVANETVDDTVGPASTVPAGYTGSTAVGASAVGASFVSESPAAPSLHSDTIATGGTYRFVDTGEWGIVRTPRVGVTGRYVGRGEIRVERESRVIGDGIASASIAVLGPYEAHTGSGPTGSYRLIVPDAATLEPSPAAVFESFANAERTLRVGSPDTEVFAVAAPTTAGVSWGVRGSQVGSADLWVRDMEPTASADDVWTHEYVHTRQTYRAEPSARWITEATATYYAALFAFERGAVDFDAFERVLARGTREPDATAILTDPNTWRVETPYTKGALVAGELDRQIRLASDGQASLVTVVRDLNEAPTPVTDEMVLDAVESAAGASGDRAAAAAVREEARRLTDTEATATPWDRRAHADAFGETPALVGYRIAEEGVQATGPYRNRTVAQGPVQLVPGETLIVPVTISNTGGRAGSYEVSLTVDDRTIATRTGRLDPGVETAASFEHRFTETGQYTVRVAGETVTVVVTEPAPVLIRDVTTDRDELTAGESVRVTAQVGSDALVPANSTIVVQVDGESVATRTVRLDAGEATAIEWELPIDPDEITDDPRPVTIRVLGPESTAETTVTVASGTAKPESVAGEEGTDSDDGAVSTPGFGPIVAIVALLATAQLARRREGKQ